MKLALILLLLLGGACSRPPPFDPKQCFDVERVTASLAGTIVTTPVMPPSRGEIAFVAERKADVIDVSAPFKWAHPNALWQCQKRSAVPLRVTAIYFLMKAGSLDDAGATEAQIQLFPLPFAEVDEPPILIFNPYKIYRIRVSRDRKLKRPPLRKVKVLCETLKGIDDQPIRKKYCEFSYHLVAKIAVYARFQQDDISERRLKRTAQSIIHMLDMATKRN